MRFGLALGAVVCASWASWCMTGCSDDPSDAPPVADPVVESEIPSSVDVVADGFELPTQIVDGPDGIVLVAQLVGAENERRGEVVAFDPVSGRRTVILRGLDKPTGVLWAPGEVWVMVRRGLIRAPWSGEGDAGPVEVVLSDLPFNGRSEGTLTSLAGLPGHRFLYETSGTLSGGGPAPGSGTLWVFDPADRSSTPIATGLKNAYAHRVLDSGEVLVTDIGDGGNPVPVEELNVVDIGPIRSDEPADPVDMGWPRCPGDQVCASVTSPVATFSPSSTPTGVAVVGDDAYVALFVTGQIVSVPLPRATGSGDSPARDPIVVLDGLAGPHTLLERPGGELWISEHLTGRILSIQT
jgi:glucose/arabinose dehydrogenase